MHLSFDNESDWLGDLGDDKVRSDGDVDRRDILRGLLVEDGERRLPGVPVARDDVPVVRRGGHRHVFQQLHVGVTDVPPGRH